MEQKRYGVKVKLLEELHQFQLALLKKKLNMPVVGQAKLYINTPVQTLQVQAQQRVLSIGGLIMQLPTNTNISHSGNYVTITVENLSIMLIFENEESKSAFIAALGDFTEISLSDDTSTDSGKVISNVNINL